MSNCVEALGMTATYRVILAREADEAAYNVIIPAFPTAHTFGGTLVEALAHAREVIELLVEEYEANGERVPPSDVDSVIVESVTVSLSAA